MRFRRELYLQKPETGRVSEGKGKSNEDRTTKTTTKEKKEKKERREEKKIEQTPCSMLMTIHVKPQTQTVGKTRLNHSQETNS
jgi:hypothetical protein